jgi:hypothetical protein
MTAPELTDRLEKLQDEYTYRVNMLLDEGREDLAARLAERYSEEANRALRSSAN